jgi:hypothetical protein
MVCEDCGDEITGRRRCNTCESLAEQEQQPLEQMVCSGCGIKRKKWLIIDAVRQEHFKDNLQLCGKAIPLSEYKQKKGEKNE